MNNQTVSIIIPVLNEEHYIEPIMDFLGSLNPSPYEIIVVDGGSTDNTSGILKEYDVKFYHTLEASRSIQMNAGAHYAVGDIFVFLHADTTGPDNLVEIVRKHLEDPKVVLGGFVSRMRGVKNQKILSFLNFTKTYFWALILNPGRFFFNGFRILFGDQVMFCRKKDFKQIGGFNESYPILEDAELCKRMNKLGKIRQFTEKVYSSDRRVSGQGFFKAFRIYFTIGAAWTLGYSAEKLAGIYKNIR